MSKCSHPELENGVCIDCRKHVKRRGKRKQTAQTAVQPVQADHTVQPAAQPFEPADDKAGEAQEIIPLSRIKELVEPTDYTYIEQRVRRLIEIKLIQDDLKTERDLKAEQLAVMCAIHGIPAVRYEDWTVTPYESSNSRMDRVELAQLCVENGIDPDLIARLIGQATSRTEYSAVRVQQDRARARRDKSPPER